LRWRRRRDRVASVGHTPGGRAGRLQHPTRPNLSAELAAFEAGIVLPHPSYSWKAAPRLIGAAPMHNLDLVTLHVHEISLAARKPRRRHLTRLLLNGLPHFAAGLVLLAAALLLSLG
jgi:hypothetical protein